ncbi:MAG: hypothetical protein HY881_04280 [Deltaproteobacteria bacterium]|nr:hypothetical protein [Deltaproteobacteria bacterium]
MTDLINYVCAACGKKRTLPANEPTPECCRETMNLEPLPVCETAPSAEHSRLDDDSSPCDDGSAG